jgi:hypothetical protein
MADARKPFSAYPVSKGEGKLSSEAARLGEEVEGEGGWEFVLGRLREGIDMLRVCVGQPKRLRQTEQRTDVTDRRVASCLESWFVFTGGKDEERGGTRSQGK